MKLDNLHTFVREKIVKTRKQRALVDLEPDLEMAARSTRKKRNFKRNRSRLSKLGWFFMGEEEEGKDVAPYELDDGAWLAPMGATDAGTSEPFEMKDEVWCNPLIAV